MESLKKLSQRVCRLSWTNRAQTLSYTHGAPAESSCSHQVNHVRKMHLNVQTLSVFKLVKPTGSACFLLNRSPVALSPLSLFLVSRSRRRTLTVSPQRPLTMRASNSGATAEIM